MGVRLAGFVLHGNNRESLGRCLASLQSVCDEVLALDSGSSDGSVQIARQLGVRSETHAWRGFGAARATAERLLGPADYLFFLDSDEWLEEPAQRAILQWKTGNPGQAFYRLVRRDWVSLEGRRFLYRHEHKRRLIRRDHAKWHESMIVHEALPPGSTSDLDAKVEHDFVTSLEVFSGKSQHYAKLWAERHRGEAREGPPGFMTKWAHLLRDGVLKGAFWRGGYAAWQVANVVADYHVWKYRYLKQLHGAARVRPGDSDKPA